MNLILVIFEFITLYFKAMDGYKEISDYFTNTMELYRRKRKLQLNMLLALNVQLLELLALLEAENLLSNRTLWIKMRTKSFWEIDCVAQDDDDFKTNFRITRTSFIKLMNLLSDLDKKDSKWRKAIPLDKRVAIALYALGSSAEYRSIGNLFGVGKSTVCQIVSDFCDLAWPVLQNLYLNHIPLTREKIDECREGFLALGFPQCLGAIDGCHIEIHPPAEDAADYHNYKGWYSTILLALVDYRCRFLYVNVGAMGKCNDSQLFEQSQLKSHLDNCNFLNEMSISISGVEIPILILGDSAFKFSPMVMKPYPFYVEQNPNEKNFNYSLSKCRRVVENAFGHLKARFRRVGKGIDNHLKNANKIILTCCALHNFLNEENDTINETWVEMQKIVDTTRDQPEFSLPSYSTNSRAGQIRKALAEHFSNVGVGDSSIDGVGDASGSPDDLDPIGVDDGDSISIGDDAASECMCVDADDVMVDATDPISFQLMSVDADDAALLSKQNN